MKTQSINIIWLVYKGEIKKISKCDNYFKILHHKMIQLNEYKDLYKEVGVKYKWLGRIQMDNKKLEEIILDVTIEILRAMEIDPNLHQIIQTMIILREKFLEESFILV